MTFILVFRYFQRLVEDFERQMALYRQQFFDAEKFFASINHSSASNPSGGCNNNT